VCGMDESRRTFAAYVCAIMMMPIYMLMELFYGRVHAAHSCSLREPGMNVCAVHMLLYNLQCDWQRASEQRVVTSSHMHKRASIISSLMIAVQWQ
jgi:hypothetical protein